MDSSDLREALCRAGIILSEKGLVARTWGNLSLRLDTEYFLVSPSGIFYEETTPEHISRVRIADTSWEGSYKPSSERGLHALVYERFEEVNAIIHTHQSGLSALAAARQSLGKKIPSASYALPTTGKLARSSLKAMEEAGVLENGSRAVILANHGAVIAAPTMEIAIETAEALEERVSEMIHQIREDTALTGLSEPRQRLFRAYDKASEESIQTPLQFGRNQADTPDFIRALFQKREDINIVQWVKSPYVLAYSGLNKPLKPLLDDMAQLIGLKALVGGKSPREAVKALGKRSAFFLPEEGAVAVGPNETEAAAVAMVLEKSARSAVDSALVGKGYSIPRIEAAIMRLIYLKKYSKLGQNDQENE